MEKTARHVIFSGRVQGVGFRYMTRRIADRHELTGWVRNLPNGTVEALFQGLEADIQVCLNEIDDAFSGSLRDKKITPQPLDPRFSGFDITY